MARALKEKELTNTRLANHYGGWVYCEGCNKTIGYLCYVTYNRFALEYTCKCGNCGSVRLAFEDECTAKIGDAPLMIIKNRLCCPEDASPLVTILSKNLAGYQCQVVCKACHTKYEEEQEICAHSSSH